VEVVVSVHAGWTTTSEESQFNIVTDSKRKLMTHETETASNIQEVIVAKPSTSTTTSKQPQPLFQRLQTVCAYMFKYNRPITARSHTQRDDDDNTA